MPRIDPAHPPLWRTPTTLQFGADPVAVVHDPTAWQQRLVRELERGIPDSAVVPFAEALGAPAHAAEEFVARIRRAFAAPSTHARRVVVQASDDVAGTVLDTVARALAATGCDVVAAQPFDPPGGVGTDAAAVVVVAHHLVAPAFAAALMADDRHHLPLVLTGTGAEIGPHIVPGVTACLSCLAAHRRDADASWPTVAAQLIGRPVGEIDPSIVWEAGIVAGRLLSETERNPLRDRTRSLALRAGSLHRSAQRHRPHAECRCRSLAGTGTAAAPVRLEPTRPTAFARPA